MRQFAKTGPPFDFQGHLSESQKEAFYNWMGDQSKQLPEIALWWRIRSQQLRKSAGVLEHQSLVPNRWDKSTWSPGTKGHTNYPLGDDQAPSRVVGEMKEIFKGSLKVLDEQSFQMLNIRTMIEKAEDQAQKAQESPIRLLELKQTLDALFASPEYEEVLVRDQSDSYQGKPRYRTNSLDEPTPWERWIKTRSDSDFREV